MQSSQPWVLAKGSAEEVARCGSVIALCCNLAAIISILLSPYMPATADVMFTQLNLAEPERLLTDSFKPDLLKPGHVMGKVSIFSSFFHLGRQSSPGIGKKNMPAAGAPLKRQNSKCPLCDDFPFL